MNQISNASTANLKLRGGEKLADAPPGENIVITGISGYFPNSDNVQDFMENLLNKIDLCDDDERRFAHKNNDIPKLSGKIINFDKFDRGYFGIPELHVKWMDPMGRMLLERTVEALMDAGINPVELKGTKTGVYIGVCHSETEKYSCYNTRSQTYPIAGCTRSMLAHRISYALRLNGPSFIFDTACSSGLYAFDAAYRSIREGMCDMAIVAGSNMCFNYNTTLQFARLGVLNMNTGCRPFDRDADGYTRSEAAVAIILQKEKSSRRVYAKVCSSFQSQYRWFQTRGKPDTNITDILNCIGSLYELGFTPRVDNIFPKINWPVSSGTPMLSPLVKWNHSKNYPVAVEENVLAMNDEKKFKINVMGTDAAFYKGHVIDGRNLFPATGYIHLVWNLLADLISEPQENTLVCFENVKFLRATTFPKEGIHFVISINNGGNFEIVDGDSLVASGKVSVLERSHDPPKPLQMKDDVLSLSHNDIYKELRIRGYEYKGVFKAVQQIQGNEALVKWSSNWIAFLDNILQLCIIKEDSRSLAVPIGIDRLIINPQSFLEYVETLDADSLVPCYVNTSENCVHTKGIQIIGLKTSSISRKRQIHKPVLENYKFVPNILTTNVSDSMRINMQIVLENKQVINMKVLEVINNESDVLQALSPEILKAAEDMPLIQPEITVFTKTNVSFETKGILLETNKVSYDRSNLIYIGSNLLEDEKEMQCAISAIVDDGFIITIEKAEYMTRNSGFNILTEHTINNKFIYLLTKPKKLKISKIVDCSNLENMENWLSAVRLNFGKNSRRLIMYAQNNNFSGILGFTNCIRREQNGECLSTFFIRDEAPSFDPNDNFYKSQVEKGLGVNVYQDGKWGTYRHLLCNPNAKISCEHFYGSPGIRAINFRDVMLASGKLAASSVMANRLKQDCLEGSEFSGRDNDGNRIMGIAECGSNSNLVQSNVTWEIPSHWSLEDAATVPVMYLTVLKAFAEAKIKQGQSVLIHSGTGGIGQAALNLSLYYKCNVFTTVGSEEKKKYILKHYPHVKKNHIGNSRNTTFEEMVMRETSGQGVDIVLNSLSDDKLHASIRCLAKGGYFMEIGKYDILNDTRVSAELLRKKCTYQGIMLDLEKKLDDLFALFEFMLDMSYIKPLNRKVFGIDELENAFRYMMTRNHIGKVLVKIRDEEKNKIVRPAKITHYAVPKFYCDPNLSYIILGGLGGFGLELADWLMLRGAKTLVLSSRKGVRTGYQQYRIRHWNDNGVKTLILVDDITTYDGCKKLIQKANSVAPVGAIFNLAVELRDGLLDNLTHNDFQTSLYSKAYPTIYMNDISKQLCPNLHQFVVFSSVSCGRGNVGQTNYGLSNSIMERICEQRKTEGLPALAVQWGAIGDVGLVAEMQKEATEIAIGGTLQQKIQSCLDVLDKFLKQNEAVVSSIIVADKFQSNKADNMLNTVVSMLGISDIKSISMHAALSEIGMDSMLGIEIKQTLERDYDIFLSTNEIRKLTFARLSEMYDSMQNNTASLTEDSVRLETLLKMNQFDENTYQDETVEVNTNKDNSKLVLFIPGIEGNYINFQPLMNGLKYTSICLQHNQQGQIEQFEDVINYYYSIAKNLLTTNNTFNIIAHSLGGVLALNIISNLEKIGYIGNLVLIDSSWDYIHKYLSFIDSTSDEDFEVKLILKMLENYLPLRKIPEVAEKLAEAESTKERLDILKNVKYDNNVLNNYLQESALRIFATLATFNKYEYTQPTKLKSKVLLCKPSIASIKDFEDDYYLSNYVENLEIKTFNGDHLSILENEEIVEEIHKFFEN